MLFAVNFCYVRETGHFTRHNYNIRRCQLGDLAVHILINWLLLRYSDLTLMHCSFELTMKLQNMFDFEYGCFYGTVGESIELRYNIPAVLLVCKALTSQ